MKIEQREFEGAKQHLLSAFHILAPTGLAQEALVTMVLDMQADGREPEEILREIVAALQDGLCFGNWLGEAKS